MRIKGHTLIEFVIVMVLLSVFSLFFAAFITQAADSWVFVRSREDAWSQARYSMNRIISELRRVNNPIQITVMQSAECLFVDISGQTVDFKQTGDELYRNSDILATGAQSPGGLVFTYLDSSGSPTAESLNIRSVRIKISIAKNLQSVTLESSARIRNL